MVRLDEIKLTPPKVLLYGEPGTGKTVSLLTLGKSLQVCDLDNGLRSGLNKQIQDEFSEARREPDVVQFLDSHPDRSTAFPLFRDHVKKVFVDSVNGKYPYKVLGIDSLTALSDLALRDVQGASGHIGRNPEIQEWGKAFIMVEYVMMLIRAMPIAVVVTAHQHTYEVDDETKVRIAVPGQKLPAKICGYFDEVWRTKIVELPQGRKDYIIQTMGTRSVLARTRSGVPDGQSLGVGLRKVFEMMGFFLDSKPA